MVEKYTLQKKSFESYKGSFGGPHCIDYGRKSNLFDSPVNPVEDQSPGRIPDADDPDSHQRDYNLYYELGTYI